MDGPVFKALIDIIEVLKKRKIRFAVIGGLAVSWRGEPRATGDVDIVVDMDVKQAVALKDELNQTPFSPLFPEVSEVIESSFILPLIHDEAKVTVDSAGRFRRRPVTADSIPPTPCGWIIAIDEIGMLEEVLVKHELVHFVERGEVQLALNPWRDEKQAPLFVDCFHLSTTICLTLFLPGPANF